MCKLSSFKFILKFNVFEIKTNCHFFSFSIISSNSASSSNKTSADSSSFTTSQSFPSSADTTTAATTNSANHTSSPTQDPPPSQHCIPLQNHGLPPAPSSAQSQHCSPIQSHPPPLAMSPSQSQSAQQSVVVSPPPPHSPSQSPTIIIHPQALIQPHPLVSSALQPGSNLQQSTANQVQPTTQLNLSSHLPLPASLLYTLVQFSSPPWCPQVSRLCLQHHTSSIQPCSPLQSQLQPLHRCRHHLQLRFHHCPCSLCSLYKCSLKFYPRVRFWCRMLWCLKRSFQLQKLWSSCHFRLFLLHRLLR